MPPFEVATLRAENKRLTERLKRFASCDAATDMWKVLDGPQPGKLQDRQEDAFIAIAQKLERPIVTLDDILQSVFPQGHAVARQGDVVTGYGPLAAGGDISVVRIVSGKPLPLDDVVSAEVADRAATALRGAA